MIFTMKAMILAAGLGTRLLPLTEKTPKPLLPILDQPLIDVLIRALKNSGYEAVIINTHHLGHMVDEFLEEQDYGLPVVARFEPTILGTGGGIKNVEDFWNHGPFLVINGDILTNIDLAKVYGFHNSHGHPVTMVLHDCAQFNNVWVDSQNHITGFGRKEPCPPSQAESLQTSAPAADEELPSFQDKVPLQDRYHRELAFTGIHVVDPLVLDFVPKGSFCSIIDIYCDMIQQGITLKAYIATNHYWHDIGTVEGYRRGVRDALARKALKDAFEDVKGGALAWSRLKGDGSDRTWYRVSQGGPSVIVADHGPPKDATCAADSFFAIGRHLYSKGIAVPRIYVYDRPSGLVALEDLGNVHLQTVIRRTPDSAEIARHYRTVIDLLVFMGIEGAKDFDPAYTYETAGYDRDLIMEKEARYFVTAFLNGYMKIKIDFNNLEQECQLLAERALETSTIGFLHRDFQSRNILVKDNKYSFIDFQGGRFGPLQYDLASLLIDPYVGHPQGLQEELLAYYLTRLRDFMPVDAPSFRRSYKYCAINRNLQILGAFAFLSRVKGKKGFEAYIPQAVRSLKQNIGGLEPDTCKQLRRIVEGL